MSNIAELAPALIGLVLLVFYKRVADELIRSAVRFHSSDAQKRRAEGQVRLARVSVVVAAVAFIVLAVVSFSLAGG